MTHRSDNDSADRDCDVNRILQNTGNHRRIYRGTLPIRKKGKTALNKSVPLYYGLKGDFTCFIDPS